MTADLEPWSIYVGAPARRVRARASEQILESQEALFRAEGPPARHFLYARELDGW